MKKSDWFWDWRARAYDKQAQEDEAYTRTEPSHGRTIPGWRMSEEDLRALASQISAGRSLVPEAWPDEGRVAVVLSFDVDTETWELMNGGHPSLSDLSQGAYGARVGVRRVVELLKEYHVPASFFVPAVSAVGSTKSVSTARNSCYSIAVRYMVQAIYPPFLTTRRCFFPATRSYQMHVTV